MYKLVVGIALAVLTYGCNTMTSPQSTFERGEVVNHGIFDDALVVAQVVSTNMVHAYSVSDAGFTYGLRIAILPLSDDYVNGQHIRRGFTLMSQSKTAKATMSRLIPYVFFARLCSKEKWLCLCA